MIVGLRLYDVVCVCQPLGYSWLEASSIWASELWGRDSLSGGGCRIGANSTLTGDSWRREVASSIMTSKQWFWDDRSILYVSPLDTRNLVINRHAHARSFLIRLLSLAESKPASFALGSSLSFVLIVTQSSLLVATCDIAFALLSRWTLLVVVFC